MRSGNSYAIHLVDALLVVFPIQAVDLLLSWGDQTFQFAFYKYF